MTTNKGEARKPKGLAMRAREASNALAKDMNAAGIRALVDYFRYVEAQEGQEGLDRVLALFELSSNRHLRAFLEGLLNDMKEGEAVE